MYTRVIKSRKPLLLGTQQEALEAGVITINIPGQDKELNESVLCVPILHGKEMTGVVSVQSYKQNAFGKNDVRLLTTLANSMSVALQNAQSFKAEQERVAEMQIINSIQQGLASELDFQAIVDLVGDKLREVFNTPDLSITWYDEKAELLHYLYAYEHDTRLVLEPYTPSPVGMFETLRKTRQPLVLNSVTEMEKLGALEALSMFKGTPLLTVHDEVVAEVPLGWEEQALAGLRHALVTTPLAFGENAKALRLASSGVVCYNNYGEAK